MAVIKCPHCSEEFEDDDLIHIDDIGEIHGDVVTHPKQF